MKAPILALAAAATILSLAACSRTDDAQANAAGNEAVLGDAEAGSNEGFDNGVAAPLDGVDNGAGPSLNAAGADANAAVSNTPR